MGGVEKTVGQGRGRKGRRQRNDSEGKSNTKRCPPSLGVSHTHTHTDRCPLLCYHCHTPPLRQDSEYGKGEGLEERHSALRLPRADLPLHLVSPSSISSPHQNLTAAQSLQQSLTFHGPPPRCPSPPPLLPPPSVSPPIPSPPPSSLTSKASVLSLSPISSQRSSPSPHSSSPATPTPPTSASPPSPPNIPSTRSRFASSSLPSCTSSLPH